MTVRTKRCSPRAASGLQRGASSVEYAFMVALLVGSFSLLTESFQENEGDKLEDAGGRVGNPEEFVNASTTTVTIVPPTGSTTTSGGSSEAVAAMTATSSTQGSKKWTAVAEILVESTSGAPILDAEIDGVWTISYDDGRVYTASANCSSDSSGVCTLSLWNLRRIPHVDSIASAAFTISSLDAADVTPAAGVIGTSATAVAP